MHIIETLDKLTRAIEAAQVEAIEGTPLADMTERQICQMETIADLKNPGAGELAKTFKVSKPSVTAIIDRFELKGLVRRVAEDQDRRTMHIHLTHKGEKLVAQHREIHRKIGEQLISPLSTEETILFQKLLEKILNQHI